MSDLLHPTDRDVWTEWPRRDRVTATLEASDDFVVQGTELGVPRAHTKPDNPRRPSTRKQSAAVESHVERRLLES